MDMPEKLQEPLCHLENILLLKLSGLWFNMTNGRWETQEHSFFKILSMRLVSYLTKKEKNKWGCIV